MLKTELLSLHDRDSDERCGTITLVDGELKIVECPNVHPEPHDFFAIETPHLESPGVVASWHTHPRTGSNLTIQDYKSFMRFPQIRHLIISRTDVWCFVVKDGILLLDENFNFSDFST